MLQVSTKFNTERGIWQIVKAKTYTLRVEVYTGMHMRSRKQKTSTILNGPEYYTKVMR